MKTERALLSFVAIIIGLVVAAAAFYLYQSTKKIPEDKTKIVTISSPTPSPESSIYLVVDSPKDEEVVDKKTITISGKTTRDALVVVSTKTEDEVIEPASNGNFSTTVTIGDGQNQVEITSIAPNGEEAKVLRTVTFSTETF